MTTFNLQAVIKKVNEKEQFIASSAKSAAKQNAVIADTEKSIAALSLIQDINGKPVDMGQLADEVIARMGKRLTIADKAVFAFFGVTLNSEKSITRDLVSELFYAKKARLKSDDESRTNLEAALIEQKKLLLTIDANKTKAESELDSLIEFLPEQTSYELHNAAKNVAKVFGYDLGLEYSDMLSRVENVAFKFTLKDGKRVGVTIYEDILEKIDSLLEELKILQTCNSGMPLVQRDALFSGFNKINSELKLFSAGELPDAGSLPVQAPKGFSTNEVEAALAVPKEPVFNPISSFFKDIDGSLVVNCVSGIDVVNQLVQTANESRGWSILKAVKVYQKSQQAELIEKIDQFDIVLQGYLNVAMQQFISDGVTTQLDRLFSSPTIVNKGMLTPYGKQIKSYIACVLPYVSLKHKGEGVEKVYYFEPTKLNRFAKLEISENPGFYAFGVRSKSVKDGNVIDARLPVMCIRTHHYILKLLRDLKRADDKRIKEAHAREWADYRSKYGKEYDRRTLQSEIDALAAALAAKTKDLANMS